MIPSDLLAAARLRVRKTSENALDRDIEQLAAVAVTDMRRIGVREEYLDELTDPLVREVVLTYVNANYGTNPDREKLTAAYHMLLVKLKGGDYCDSADGAE